MKFRLFSFSDAPEAWGMNFQDPATPIAEGMLYFHSYLMLFLIITGIFVFWMLLETVRLFNSKTSPISESFEATKLATSKIEGVNCEATLHTLKPISFLVTSSTAISARVSSQIKLFR